MNKTDGNLPKREVWLDCAKGLAIILVVAGHSLNHFDDASLHRLCEIIYLFHMPLFVFLSGYGFYFITAHKTTLSHICNNICIYVIQSVIYICLNAALGRVISTSNHYTLFDLITLPVIPVAHFWYLQAIVIYYCIFALYEKITHNIHTAYILELITVSVLFVLSRTVDVYFISRICYHSLFFGMGYFLNMYVKSRSSGISAKRSCKMSVLSYPGRNSLWIYIFHPYVTSCINAVLGRLNPGNLLLEVVIMILAATLFPLLLRFIMVKSNTAWFVTDPALHFWKRLDR